jgi:hypothetical protein
MTSCQVILHVCKEGQSRIELLHSQRTSVAQSVVLILVLTTPVAPAKRMLLCILIQVKVHLAAEAVEGAALALEGVHDVHGGDGLPASVLGVGDSVADDVLEENLEHRAGLLVDEARDTLHTTTASKTADSGLGDTLDVVTKNLPVTLGASFAKALATLATSRHTCCGTRLVFHSLQIALEYSRGPPQAKNRQTAGCHLPPPRWLVFPAKETRVSTPKSAQNYPSRPSRPALLLLSLSLSLSLSLPFSLSLLLSISISLSLSLHLSISLSLSVSIYLLLSGLVSLFGCPGLLRAAFCVCILLHLPARQAAADGGTRVERFLLT